MPVISMFYGIIISMYFFDIKKHKLPHIHTKYQDQEAIVAIGEEAAARHDLAFYFENFRRGWAEHAKMTREHGLYSQRYCGCVYSEWEARDRNAADL